MHVKVESSAGEKTKVNMFRNMPEASITTSDKDLVFINFHRQISS